MINMKYQVIYYKSKKNKTTKQIATFYKIEDASFWEKMMISQGHQNIEIVPVFSK